MEDESIFGDALVYRFTRKMAIESGILVDFNISDLDSITKKFWKLPFASTITVFNIIETAVDGGATWAGILHDVFFMAQHGPGTTTKTGIGEERHFQVTIGESLYALKINIGPGDSREGVITMMLENED